MSSLQSNTQHVAQILFNPVHAASKQPNAYSTVSLNQKAVQQFFGPQGLNVASDTLRYIQNFYFF